MLGFWLLFFLYPLNGTHHYVFSVIPMAAQVTAIAASALLGVDVVIVVANLLLSTAGRRLAAARPGLRFVATGTVFYLVVSLQGASQAQMAVNQTIHFTDWVVGHSHMAMLGFATLRGRRRPRPRLAAHPVGALQRARPRVGVLAARRRRADDVRGPDRRRHGRGRTVAVGGAVARFGARRAAVLGDAHRRRRADRRAASWRCSLGLTTGPRGAGLTEADAVACRAGRSVTPRRGSAAMEAP